MANAVIKQEWLARFDPGSYYSAKSTSSDEHCPTTLIVTVEDSVRESTQWSEVVERGVGMPSIYDGARSVTRQTALPLSRSLPPGQSAPSKTARTIIFPTV